MLEFQLGVLFGMVHTILDWLTKVLDWFSKRDWKDWEMWAAIGQIVGAFATFWTARIALKLARETKRYEKQMRKREKEAIEPELFPKVAIKDNENEKKIVQFTLANIKPTPAFINDFIFVNVNQIPEIEPYSYEIIETEAPVRVVYGGACNTKVPLSYLKRLLTENDRTEGFFQFQFSIATGKTYTFSVCLKQGNIPSEWFVYLADHEVTQEEILQTGMHIHYIQNRIVKIKRHGDKNESI
jgi:hypothetical protein